MSKITFTGVNVLLGVPTNPKRIVGAPGGRQRLIVNRRGVVKLEVRTRAGALIGLFLLENCGETWKVRRDLYVKPIRVGTAIDCQQDGTRMVIHRSDRESADYLFDNLLPLLK